MTLLITNPRWIHLTCKCRHTFDFMLPQSITSWDHPEFLETLVEGGFYYATCPKCRYVTTVEGEIMLNSPKGIVLIPNGPPEKLKKILFKLEVVDKKGTTYSAETIADKLHYNLNHLKNSPILEKQQQKTDFLDQPINLFENEGKEKKKKRFFLF